MATNPFAHIICTPDCFMNNIGKKQIIYNGYHELAYLQNSHYKPNPQVLDEIGVKATNKYAIIRFVSWQAAHDVGHHGFSIESKRSLISKISQHARILITSESPLPEEFEKYRIKVSPEKIHDLLYYANIYVGEGGTMASESAILGTPAVLMSSLAKFCGTQIDMHSNYDLLYYYDDPELAIQKAVDLIQQPNLKKEWAEKRQKLLNDKIDVTQFMVDLIENYPDSLDKIKNT